jgi:rhodanese-related sulfurtransferase
MEATRKTAAQLVGEARQRVENLTPAQAAAEIRRGQAVLVDLREPNECAQTGTIAGAIQAPRGMLEFYADPSCPYHRAELQPDRRVILYCASGGRSALAADVLASMGYVSVAHLDGGLKAWQAAGYVVEAGGS